MCQSVAVLAMLRREEASHTSSVVQDKRLRLRGLLELFKDLPSITQARNEDNSWQFHSFAEGSVLLDGLEASGVQKHHRHGSKPVQVLTACAKVTMQFKHVQACCVQPGYAFYGLSRYYFLVSSSFRPPSFGAIECLAAQYRISDQGHRVTWDPILSNRTKWRYV